MSEIIKELRLHGLNVFNINDVARLTGKNRNYLYLILSKSKTVGRAQNGLYYLDGTDPFEIASRIAVPSYISLISAFSYYKVIDQAPRVIKLISTKRHKTVKNLRGVEVEVKTLKKSMFYGYHRERGIVIADLEKAVVDSLYLNEDARYLREVIANGLEGNQFGLNKLKDYTLRSGSKSVIKRAEKLSEEVR